MPWRFLAGCSGRKSSFVRHFENEVWGFGHICTFVRRPGADFGKYAGKCLRLFGIGFSPAGERAFRCSNKRRNMSKTPNLLGDSPNKRGFSPKFERAFRKFVLRGSGALPSAALSFSRARALGMRACCAPAQCGPLRLAPLVNPRSGGLNMPHRTLITVKSAFRERSFSQICKLAV